MTEQEREKLAAADIKRYQAETGCSDAQAALEALSIYYGYRLTPPKWATETIRKAWEEYQTGVPQGMRRGTRSVGQVAPASKTFDEVLRLSKPTGNQERRVQHLAFPVYEEVKRLYAEGHKLIDGENGAYDLAGKKFGMGHRTARQLCKQIEENGALPITGTPRKS